MDHPVGNQTALHLAAGRVHDKIVEVLVQAKADLSARTDDVSVCAVFSLFI